MSEIDRIMKAMKLKADKRVISSKMEELDAKLTFLESMRTLSKSDNNEELEKAINKLNIEFRILDREIKGIDDAISIIEEEQVKYEVSQVVKQIMGN